MKKLKKLPRTGQKWLKLVHILLISGWFGAGLAMNMLVVLDDQASSKDSLLFLYQIILFIDMKIVVPCATGTVLLGLLYGFFTPWGFKKYRWILCKWGIALIVIFTGSNLTATWLKNLQQLVEQQGLAALSDPTYLNLVQNNLYLGIAQMILLAVATGLSIFKNK